MAAGGVGCGQSCERGVLGRLLVAVLCGAVVLTASEYVVGGSKREQEQAKQLEVTGRRQRRQCHDRPFPSVRAFPTRQGWGKVPRREELEL